MKITAYKVDCCNTIKEENDCYGVLYMPGLFSDENSFKTVNPDKATTHYCVECYTSNVIDCALKYMKRKYKIEELDSKRQELRYVFLKSLFSRQLPMP